MIFTQFCVLHLPIYLLKNHAKSKSKTVQTSPEWGRDLKLRIRCKFPNALQLNQFTNTDKNLEKNETHNTNSNDPQITKKRSIVQLQETGFDGAEGKSHLVFLNSGDLKSVLIGSFAGPESPSPWSHKMKVRAMESEFREEEIAEVDNE